jgi:hypothetical protein
MRETGLCCVAACAAALLVSAPSVPAQTSAERGRLEFVARVTPASGRAEPARGLTIFLLSKSYRDIRREADEKTPHPDQGAFIDRLLFSPELKDWMKKQHTVTIIGAEFRNRVSPDDLFRIPEFLDAYVNSNLSGLNQGFPNPKYNAEDRTLNPKKYEASRKTYEIQLRKYLALHPDSKDGMDTILGQVDPSNAWGIELMHRRERAHALALQLAQTDYFAAKTETNLDGRGAFDATPGSYWLSTLDGEALGGDLHLRWDVGAEVRAGAVTRVELNNLNAEKQP